MRNNDLIETAVCAQYTPEQLHKLAAHYYTADEIASAAAKIIVEPGEDGTAPDPVEIAEETLCAALFHTFDGWKSPRNGGLSVKRGEKAVIRCKLWKYKDSPKPEDLPADADPLTRAAAEQGGGDYYMTTAYLFGRWQVEKREPKKPAEKRFKSLDDIRAYNKMLADQRKAVKAAAAQQDKPQITAQPAPAPQKTNAPSAADLKKAADKAKREFMAVSEEDRPAQAKALAKWRDTRQAVADAESAPKTAAPAPEAKPQTKAAPAASADSAPAYCEQTSFC
ncbi:hypothetical protein [Ruminococcus sp.]|uniref:hypothetical protein n=1 Tax=Ruminococcus sp. TaxID=41978 RepID=UPI003AAA8D64